MMEDFIGVGLGWFTGFAFGIGCSLVVLYAIYLGGYRRAIADSLARPQPERYIRLAQRAKKNYDTETRP
jgi:hypothetical protein